jgi:GNAT superfamily N-acetyltransferase
MELEVRQESSGVLGVYGGISASFEVADVFDVAAKADGRFVLTKQRAARPYVKDYDAADGEGPITWQDRFDLSNWAFFSAFRASERVGAAAVARRTPGMEQLEGRADLAVLWDLRVDPPYRRRGVGAALFAAAEAWARAAGCAALKIETQNVNVAACLFYARTGCILRAAHPGVYPDFPDEVQLLWYKDLGRSA